MTQNPADPSQPREPSTRDEVSLDTSSREGPEAAREQVQAELEQLMTELREVNQRLVVATVHAQTMAEDAERANRLKDEFLATVSHELRTPLNAVLGWARMLGTKELAPERVKHGIATIERNAAALAHIIEDLLDVSRTIVGNFHLEARPVDLVAVTQAALDVVRPLAVTKHVQLVFSSDPAAVRIVQGDGPRLEQVIWNLVANAIKFTPEHGRVDVFVEASTDPVNHVEVRVVDTGQGINAEFLPRVFDRFSQADGTTTRRHAGLGLGLTIVRQLVALHGGTVHAMSEGEGRGATFIVRVPVSAGEAMAAQAATTGDSTAASVALSLPGVPPLDNVRVLVVDDHADGRTLTTLMLTQAGATVHVAATVRDALRALDVARPDVLVSDIGLPDQDGYALIRHVREHEARQGGFLPAVALTGFVRATDRARVLAAGFQAYVPKPVNPVELTAAIATITNHLRGVGPDRLRERAGGGQ